MWLQRICYRDGPDWQYVKDIYPWLYEKRATELAKRKCGIFQPTQGVLMDVFRDRVPYFSNMEHFNPPFPKILTSLIIVTSFQGTQSRFVIKSYNLFDLIAQERHFSCHSEPDHVEVPTLMQK